MLNYQQALHAYYENSHECEDYDFWDNAESFEQTGVLMFADDSYESGYLEALATIYEKDVETVEKDLENLDNERNK